MESDAKFSSEGIVSVEKNRWEVAQSAEKSLWMDEGLFWSSDRNESHSEGFDGYSCIRGRNFNRSLEVGCGPFTNTRLIAKACTIQRCSLLDPLIKDYINHPCCAYTSKKLFLGDLDPLSLIPTLSRKILKISTVFGKFAHSILQRLRGGNYIKVERIISSPLEEAKIEGDFDLLIMINVIEHCYNFKKVCEALLSTISKGSIFVFHDRLYTTDEIESDLKGEFDPYHPLRIEKSTLIKFLQENFKEIYSKKRMDRFKSEDKDFEYEVLYFIGQRI